jgi:hypothetical protein
MAASRRSRWPAPRDGQIVPADVTTFNPKNSLGGR